MLDALDMIRRASSVPPALEEIIETAEDLRQAKAIGYIFKLSHRADTDDMQKWTVKESLKFVKAFAHPDTQKDIPKWISTLRPNWSNRSIRPQAAKVVGSWSVNLVAAWPALWRTLLA